MAIRIDVATLGSGWNDTLHHYALAIRELWELPLSDRNGWRFFGAIHGFDHASWLESGIIEGVDAIPNDFTNETYGNQCQHASWYFLPWHRGYLAAFESIVAAKVKELTGSDWTLPYWNYLDASNPAARELPDAFTLDTLPDNSPNPLKFYRGGNQYRHPGLSGIQPRPFDRFSLEAMDEDDFTVGEIGFGGGISDDFAQFADWTGGLESNPHNIVHVLMGRGGGLIGNPYTAALDPLFWLHHCNIDRLWEAWMRTAGKKMVTDPRWRDGPANRRFVMPSIGGASPGIEFSGRDTLAGGKFHPSYDDLTIGTGVVPGASTVTRVGMGPSSQQVVEVIGANADPVIVTSAPSTTQVMLQPEATRDSVATMGATEEGEKITRLYLALESVRSDAPSTIVDAYLNLADGQAPEEHSECHAGSIALFGLNVASDPAGPHGGNGLSYTLDITDLATKLENLGRFDIDQIKVTLTTSNDFSDAGPVTVGRVAVLKRSGVVS